jgi:hypothetical protein
MYSFVSCWVPLEGVLFDIKGRGEEMGEEGGEERSAISNIHHTYRCERAKG